MNAFGFRPYYFCLFFGIFLCVLTDLGFQACQALPFSITLPRRKILFRKIFDSTNKPVAQKVILKKHGSNGQPGERISFLLPLTKNPQSSLRSCRPVQINGALYSSRLTPIDHGNFWKFDFEKIQDLPTRREDLRISVKKPIHKPKPSIDKRAQNLPRKLVLTQKVLETAARQASSQPSLVPPSYRGKHFKLWPGSVSNFVPPPAPPSV